MRQPVLIHRRPWRWDPIESLFADEEGVRWQEWTCRAKEATLEESAYLSQLQGWDGPWRRL